uniref:MARVEL domain-containing protein n=1 Tax=Anopheles dirus TaxID=7168 RepID=A0A182NAS4_9DIPT
ARRISRGRETAKCGPCNSSSLVEIFFQFLCEMLQTGAEFVLSPVGVAKIVSLLCMIVGGMIFVTAGDCGESRVWNVSYITITTGSALLTMVSYSSFALSFVRTDRGLKTQHIAVLAVSYCVFFFLLIASIITMTQCSRSVQVIQKIPEPLTMIAAVLLAISGTVLFLRWRATVQTEELQLHAQERDVSEIQTNPREPRKSVMV